MDKNELINEDNWIMQAAEGEQNSNVSAGSIEDGFGSCWAKCDKPDCGLQVVRPGKVQCHCDSLCSCGGEINYHESVEGFSISGYWCDICQSDFTNERNEAINSRRH